MKSTLTILLSAIIVVGCTTASRTVTSKDGAVTSTKVSTFLTTVTSFDDSVASPEGIISTTSVKNYASDVAAMQVMAGFSRDIITGALLLAGRTNSLPFTNTIQGVK